MTWKKETYLITVKNDGEKVREYVNGITTTVTDYKIGVHKADAGVWIVTDTDTGYMINGQNTQKAAKQWVSDNAEVIADVLSKPSRKALIKEIEKCRIK